MTQLNPRPPRPPFSNANMNILQKSMDLEAYGLNSLPPFSNANMDIVQKSMDFEAYGLNPRLQRQLRKVGVDRFFPVQAQCFEKVMNDALPRFWGTEKNVDTRTVRAFMQRRG